MKKNKEVPSMDAWLEEAKNHPDSSKIGMYLFHNGVVRETSRAQARKHIEEDSKVKGMKFEFNKKKADKVVEEAYEMEGVFYIKTWFNEGELAVGDDIMHVLVGGDIRPNVINGLQFLVGKIKKECVSEVEHKG